MEGQRTHLKMFVAAVTSKVMTDQDIIELYDLLLKDHEGSQIIPTASVAFHHKRPAAMMDYCRKRLEKLADDDCRMLIRQLDDPEIEDESVAQTLEVLEDKLRKSDYVAAFALVLQVRPKAVRIAHRDAADSARSTLGMIAGLLDLFSDMNMLDDDE